MRPYLLKLSSLLLCVFCSEHIYLIVRMAARTAILKLNNANMRKERGEPYMTRKEYLEELFCLLPWSSVFRALPSSKAPK
jgi:anoctamin-10